MQADFPKVYYHYKVGLGMSQIRLLVDLRKDRLIRYKFGLRYFKVCVLFEIFLSPYVYMLMVLV